MKAGPRESCGIFGVFGHAAAAKLTYLGLFALQHRGQESAGIVIAKDGQLYGHRGLGLVSDVFSPQILDDLSSNTAIGHVRYSTTGSTLLKNTQPFLVECNRGQIAIAHNGNLVNAGELREKLQGEGSIFQSSMDTEVIAHLIAKGKENFENSLIDALGHVKGSYSLLFLTPDKMIAARDSFGNRPLCIGQLDDSYIIASETCALDLVSAKYVRDVKPGEIIIIDKTGLRSLEPFPKKKHAFCIFELIYFARPDSNIFGGNVYHTRKNLGKNLAKESPAKVDMVLPIPDSGNSAAVGYSQQLNLPFEIGIVRNHYIGRTFIQPSQFIRDFGVKIKLNPVADTIRDKKIVILEDSIVRGTTSRSRVRTLRGVGAREIHMRVSCPPIKHPCYFGIDFPTSEELIASNKSVDEIREFLGLDSLAYLSLEGLLKSMPVDPGEFCTACFSGDYPVAPAENIRKLQFEKLKFGDY